MGNINHVNWEAPHAAWFLTSTGSYLNGNLLAELLKKGYRNSFQITVKLWKTPEFYSDEELTTLNQLEFGTHRNTDDFIFCKQLTPEHSSNRLEPTPIVVTNRDMNNYVVGYLSLNDLADLMTYTGSVQSCNAARILFAFIFGIDSANFQTYWYGNPVTKLATRDSLEMLAEEQEHVLSQKTIDLDLYEERSW